MSIGGVGDLTSFESRYTRTTEAAYGANSNHIETEDNMKLVAGRARPLYGWEKLGPDRRGTKCPSRYTNTIPVSGDPERLCRANSAAVNVGTKLVTEVLVEIGAGWTRWTKATLPGSDVLSEQSIALHGDIDRMMAGRIETLLKLLNSEQILVAPQNLSRWQPDRPCTTQPSRVVGTALKGAPSDP